jgi:transcriptional regulator with XRE-family HTH domain
MNCEVLGRKLKEARLAKKMTQSDVVGNYITRNMLSQIESGAALPSIRTLEYLSGVLGVPMSELMAEDDSSKVHSAARETITCPHCGIKFEK